MLINELINRKKVKIHQIQKLTGFLNFLCRAIVLGRAFTRRMYAYTAGNVLKPHHHVKMTAETRADLAMWLLFLNDPSIYCRPFLDYGVLQAETTDFHTDASRNFSLGCGGLCQNEWMMLCWDQFVAKVEPSIEYLELYAVAVGILLWAEKFKNKRFYIFCDNMSVVHMLNNSSSTCKNCMVLIRMITLHSMKLNVRIYAKHVRTEDNGPADALSRIDLIQFHKLTQHKNMNEKPCEIPSMLWPIEKIWMK